MSAESDNEDDKPSKADLIHAVGLWSLRLALLIGGIVLALYGKDEAAGTCVTALILSFLFL